MYEFSKVVADRTMKDNRATVLSNQVNIFSRLKSLHT